MYICIYMCTHGQLGPTAVIYIDPHPKGAPSDCQPSRAGQHRLRLRLGCLHGLLEPVVGSDRDDGTGEGGISSLKATAAEKGCKYKCRCMCIHTYTCMSMYVCIYMCMYIHIGIDVYMYRHRPICTCGCTHTCTYIHTDTHTSVVVST